MGKSELSLLYKRSVLKLHPDKCSHPQAHQAFQKFMECYRREEMV